MDQARVGGWSVFNREGGSLVDCGCYDFSNTSYDYVEAILKIKELFAALIAKYGVKAVILEDIQCRQNLATYRKLAWLQGNLLTLCAENNIPVSIVQPSVWQNWCRAQTDGAGRTKGAMTRAEAKKMSIGYVKEKFGVETDNDNLADAICIGWHGVCTDMNQKGI